MPFTRTQQLAQLADQVASAMKRGDDIGMDMLRDLLPELREMIGEINLALREVDALLFEGLRDEAISLHDESFPRLVGRLNLEDLDNWPLVQQFFAAEEIAPPPAIDFDTLSALESAHSELMRLRQPLDKLRWLALQRAPLTQRLAVVRKLRNLDPGKPVWSDTIALHEQARLAELKQAVPEAIKARAPERIAELHAELVDPEWTVPIPKELVRSTLGADVWLQLRQAVGQAEAVAAECEQAFAAAADGPPPPDLAPRLRALRAQLDEARRQSEECVAALEPCPVVAGMVREERLEERLQALPARVAAPLHWLDLEDSREATTQQFAQIIARLEYLVDHPPTKKRESAWMADVESHQAAVIRSCQALPGLEYPALIRQRVEQSLASVRGRESRRRRFIVLMSVAGVAVAGAAIGLWVKSSESKRRLNDAVQELEAIARKAEHGEFDTVPESAVGIGDRLPEEPRIAGLLDEIRDDVDREVKRRRAVREALGEHAVAAAAVTEELATREGKDRLEAWPDETVEAARAYRRAYAAGGHRNGYIDIPEDCRDARDEREREEKSIAECEQRQQELEKQLREAAIEELKQRTAAAEDVLGALGSPPYAPEVVERVTEARDQLLQLQRLGALDKCDRTKELLSGADARRRLPESELQSVPTLVKQLKHKLDQAADGKAAEP